MELVELRPIRYFAWGMILGQVATLPFGVTVWKESLVYVVVQSALANIFAGWVLLRKDKIEERQESE